MAKLNYKQKTIQLTGMSSEEYRKAYDVFKHRVRNYNRLTGTTAPVSPAQSFYYYHKQIQHQLKAGKSLEEAKATLNPLLKTITELSARTGGEASKLSATTKNRVAQDIINRFHNYIYNADGEVRQNIWAQDAKRVIDDYYAGKIGIADLRARLAQIANEHHDAMNEAQNGIIGSE